VSAGREVSVAAPAKGMAGQVRRKAAQKFGEIRVVDHQTGIGIAARVELHGLAGAKPCRRR